MAQIVARRDRHHTRAFDQGNAFTSIETSQWMWPLIGGPMVSADELPQGWIATWRSGRISFRPRYGRLPMGSTHAPPALSIINLTSAARAIWKHRRCAGMLCFSLEVFLGTRSVLAEGRTAYYIHIDDTRQ